jgi:hypothetical protein
MTQKSIINFGVWQRRNPEITAKKEPCFLCVAQPEESANCPLCFGAGFLSVAPAEFERQVQRDLENLERWQAAQKTPVEATENAGARF